MAMPWMKMMVMGSGLVSSKSALSPLPEPGQWLSTRIGPEKTEAALAGECCDHVHNILPSSSSEARQYKD